MGTKIVDAETGEELEGWYDVAWSHHNLVELPECTIRMRRVEAELTVGGMR